MGDMKANVLAVVLVSFARIASADVAIVDNHTVLTIDCAKDPQVSVNGNHAKLTLTGTCTSVVLNGNHAEVTGSAIKVSINGNHNTATLDAVDAISTTGNYNTASYKRTVDAKKKKPKIGNLGKGNKITKSK